MVGMIKAAIMDDEQKTPVEYKPEMNLAGFFIFFA